MTALVFFTHIYRVGLKTQPESKCPELLANYCDMLLRKTPLSKKLTSEEIEAKLKEVVRFRDALCLLVLWLVLELAIFNICCRFLVFFRMIQMFFKYT